MKLGQLEVDLDEFAHFLVKAKQKGYARGIGKIREADGSKTFTFQEGNFHYTDNYAGSSQAPGQEIARWQREGGQQIWRMAYSGGMLPEFWKDVELQERIFGKSGFLQEVLMRVSLPHPFRGPREYHSNDFSYGVSIEGDIRRFKGWEWIDDKKIKRLVFTQDFIGGLVVPK